MRYKVATGWYARSSGLDLQGASTRAKSARLAGRPARAPGAITPGTQAGCKQVAGREAYIRSGDEAGPAVLRHLRGTSARRSAAPGHQDPVSRCLRHPSNGPEAKATTHLCPPLGGVEPGRRERELLALLQLDLVGRLRRVVVKRDDCTYGTVPSAACTRERESAETGREPAHLFLPLRLRPLPRLVRSLLPHPRRQSRHSSPGPARPSRPAARGP